MGQGVLCLDFPFWSAYMACFLGDDVQESR